MSNFELRTSLTPPPQSPCCAPFPSRSRWPPRRRAHSSPASSAWRSLPPASPSPCPLCSGWARPTFGDSGGPFQKDGGRWRLGHKGDAPIAVHRDDDRNNQPFLILGRGLGIERLAKLHDVHAVLAQRRPAGGAGVALPAGSWSFTIAWTLFAMSLPPRNWKIGNSSNAASARPIPFRFQLQIFST